MMKKYRENTPPAIEAVRLNLENIEEVASIIGIEVDIPLQIPDLRGNTMPAKIGDWVLCERDEWFSRTDDEFLDTYTEIDAETKWE